MLVKNNGNFIRIIGGVALPPGTTEIKDKEEKAFSSAIKAQINSILVEENEIEIVQGAKQKNADSITDLSAAKAIKLIEDTFDLELLDKWLDEENKKESPRVKVVAALTKQAEGIRNPDPEKVVNPDE